ncbi:hypothetical protein FGO68_gene3314 [Halteria grandinella]|uniref:Cation/H+ exchanger domain-containing protein n=1 Tax=Halteria grandinella TaxID=5974 RepID=A0A8J8T368_HALGN|nr:hypothetical protein FGO68_gene3314 [Halteria grandinella]
MKNFPQKFAQYVRLVVFCFFMARISLDVRFKGLGLMPFTLGIFPCAVECIVEACTAYWLFGMPWVLCFALGFLVAASGMTAVLPSSFGLLTKGYDINPRITKILIVASTLDNLIMTTLFHNFAVVFLNQFKILLVLTTEAVWSESTEGGRYTRIPVMIAIGLAGGLILFVPSILIYFLKRESLRKTLYFAYFCFLSIFVPIITEKLGIPDSKYLMVVVASYLIARINRKRDHELPRAIMSKIWSIGMILLFGTLGAQIIVTQIYRYVVWRSIVVIVFGILARFIVTLILTFFQVLNPGILNFREQLFLTILSLPKGLSQATLTYAMLSYLLGNPRVPVLADDLNAISTTAYLSIIITGPVVGLFVANFGPRLVRAKLVPPNPLSIGDERPEQFDDRKVGTQVNEAVAQGNPEVSLGFQPAPIQNNVAIPNQ